MIGWNELGASGHILEWYQLRALTAVGHHDPVVALGDRVGPGYAQARAQEAIRAAR